MLVMLPQELLHGAESEAARAVTQSGMKLRRIGSRRMVAELILIDEPQRNGQNVCL